MNVPLAIVAAIAENGVIGDGRGLPWHLPSDLKHFRGITMGKPLLVGRKTFESIGRALPGREIIVVTRDRAFDPPRGGGQAKAIHVVHDLDAALALAQARAQAMGADEVILAGGGNLYESLIGRAERMHPFEDLSEVQTTLQRLLRREPPLLKLLPRQRGMKEARYAHLLCGDVFARNEDLESAPEPLTTTTAHQASRTFEAAGPVKQLEEQISALRDEVAALKQQFAEFRKQFE